jgi:hypothetical protein
MLQCRDQTGRLLPLTYFRLTSSLICSASSRPPVAAPEGWIVEPWARLRTARPFPLAAVVVESVAVEGEPETSGETAMANDALEWSHFGND